MKTITVDITPDGAVKIEAAGYKGKSCEEATRFLEQALGVVDKKRRKPEYYVRSHNKDVMRQGLEEV